VFLLLALVLDMSRDRVKSVDGIGGLVCRMVRLVKISLLYYVLVLRRVFVLALWDGLRLLHFLYFTKWNGVCGHRVVCWCSDNGIFVQVSV